MILYLLRHSKAEDSSDGMLDKDRKLTQKGRVAAFTRASKWKKKLSKVDIILSSPYPRALETATIFSNVLKKEKHLSIVDALSALARSEDILNLLTDYAHKEEVLLVGHLPWLTELASLLIAGNTKSQIKLKKPGLITLKVETLSPLGGELLELR
jgi:phosphohistidine phosphatase